MDTKKAISLLREKMNEHGLTDWLCELDGAKVRFGLCNHKTKTISLSEKLVSLNSESEVMNTILHEIAHALVGQGHGHSRIWKRKAVAIGCSGKSSYNTKDVNQPEGKIILECKNCGKLVHHYKKIRGKRACGDCCRKYNNGQFTEKYLLTLKNNF